MKKKIGKILKEARIKNGLTQKDAADRLGLKTSQYISNFERGLCEPSVEHATALCEYYHVGLRELYDAMVDLYKENLYQKIYSKAKKKA